MSSDGRRGTQPDEDFIGKYANANALHRRLLDGYFAAVGELAAIIQPREFRTALEVGCGVGYSTERLRAMLPVMVKLEASEYLEWQVKEAQQRLPTVSVTHEDVYHLHRPDQSLDLIFLLEVLEHLDDYRAALAEIHRVTRYTIIGVPNEPWWRILNALRGKYLARLGNTPGHLNHWSSRGLIRLLEASGFRVLARKSPTPWTIILAQRR